MEAGEDNSGNISLKRQRAPLSDSEDNGFPSSVANDAQKRRRLEAAGQENCIPQPLSSGRLTVQETKPDTPIVPSVRSRVQQLTQRREGGAPLTQRCVSDPGADEGSRQLLLGEGEFNQRMQRFKIPVFAPSPNGSPNVANSCPRSRSDFVSGIQQKLQGTTTPSSKQASRIRQEREQELNQLPFQPISENAWLKRSTSDQSLNQVDEDAEMKDGSFTEATTSGAVKQPVNTTGEREPCDTEAPVASAELQGSDERKLHTDGQKPKPEQLLEVREENTSAADQEEHISWQQPATQTVLQLSFSEGQSFSRASFGEDQNLSEQPVDEAYSVNASESNMMQTEDLSKATEENESELFSFDEGENIDGSSCGEEVMDPSTDEELRMWRYPRDKEKVVAEQPGGIELAVGEREELESLRVEKEKGGSVEEHSECHMAAPSSETEHVKSTSDQAYLESESCTDDSLKQKVTMEHTVLFSSKRDQENIEGSKGSCEGAVIEEQKDTEGCTHEDVKDEDMDLKSDETASNSSVKQTEETQTQSRDINLNLQDVRQPETGVLDEPADSDVRDTETSEQLLETEEMEQEAVANEMTHEKQTEESHLAEGGESSKKVTFVLEPELINGSPSSGVNTSVESRGETSMSDAELNSHDETNTAEIIDQMFEEVLEYAERIEEERRDVEDTEDRDSGIGVCSGDKDKMETESEKEKSEQEAEAKDEECDENNGDELLTFPPSGILSPLSKSVEAVVTPLRLAASQESNPPSLLLTPEETTTNPAESAPLYSVDAYRTQRQNKPPPIQSVTPGLQRRAVEKARPQPSVNTKEKISALNGEAGKLQTVINQTLQALSCCTDEEHGRGSLEEAEAEKLLLVSCEKRSALLAEVARLREERSSESGEAAEEDRNYVSQKPCRGTVSITNIQLPLKVEFVCSSHNRPGRPSHYFFILIRYGPCNIVATPLATAADAQNGDTISFPTSVTLKDIRSTFEIDVEVYSLSHTTGTNCSMDRTTTTTKSRVTPRKLLNTITRSSNSLTSATLPALTTRRSSNFCLVGSHKITLTSLGHSKFPLDKMKLEGKIRRLLGDEFQEKVPFLSPLEGNVYLRLDSEGHSNVQHQGFLTMFELISGYGVWHRRYFVLEGCNMYYWNHPNDRETKDAEGSISLSSSPSQCVRPVKRDSCARPFTFELVSSIQKQQQQDNSQDTLAKCWFSADTKQERLDWMEKLSQALLDFHTWNRTSPTQPESQQSNSSSSGNLRESIL